MPEVLISDITAITDKLATAQHEKKLLEGQAKKIGKQIVDLKKEAAELMAQAGVNDFTTDEGNRISAALYIHGKIVDGDAFYGYLKERGEEGLVNISITGELFELFGQFFADTQGRPLGPGEAEFACHWSRLDSYLRERQAAEEQMPGGIDVDVYDTVVIK